MSEDGDGGWGGRGGSGGWTSKRGGDEEGSFPVLKIKS